MGLTGDLNINGDIITSGTDIVINPGGAGAITLKADDINFEGSGTITSSELKLKEWTGLGSNYVGFKAPTTITTDQLYTLPTDDGTSGQVLQTNGSGVLSFKTVVDVSNGVSDRIATFTDSDSLNGEANLTFNGSVLTVVGEADISTINVRNFSVVPAAGEYSGGARIAKGWSSTGTITAGSLYYGSDVSGFRWSLANATGTTTSTTILAVGTDDTDPGIMVLNGMVRVLNNLGGGSIGDIIYVGEVDGQFTRTAPSTSGDVVRIVGYLINPTYSIIYFNPDNSWVQIK